MSMIIRMTRSEGPHKGELYGYKCLACGGHWKIYQNPAHNGDCPEKKVVNNASS